MAGIAYVIESYGLICNKTLLAEAGYSIDDIKSFADLKKVAEDITSRSSELGFAAFTSAGMDGSSDWRFKTHLANLPIYFEYKEDGIGSTPAIKGTYLDAYRNIWDLYVNNSTCSGKDLAAKTGSVSQTELPVPVVDRAARVSINAIAVSHIVCPFAVVLISVFIIVDAVTVTSSFKTRTLIAVAVFVRIRSALKLFTVGCCKRDGFFNFRLQPF